MKYQLKSKTIFNRSADGSSAFDWSADGSSAFDWSADGSSAFEREDARKPSRDGGVIEDERCNASLRRHWRTSRPRSAGKYFLFGLIILVCLNIACESPSLKANKSAVNKTPENKVNDFQSDLETMKTAKFDYIFVFRRKDGGVLDGEDKSYIKTNSPASTNRFILSDDDKAVIAGSGYEFPAANLEALRNRFDVEDYSTPKQANNQNSGK